MRIGFDASKARHPDGIGRYTAQLLAALARLDAELEIVLYGLDTPIDGDALAAELETSDGVKVHPATRRGPCAGDVDVLHSTTWTVPPTYRGPLVLTSYDLTFLTHPECHTVDNKIRCMTGVLEARLAGALFLAISRATADAMTLLLGIGPDDVRVVHPAAAAVFGTICEGTEGTEAEDYLLSVGTLEPRKNLRRLLDAYAALPDGVRRRHPLLLVGGDGWKVDQEELLCRAELSTVRRLGVVSDAELAALYARAALFVYPSLAEGFGLPVLEAMSCGAPVAASAIPVHAEVTEGAARLVDPLDVDALRDALQELLDDPAARRRLADAGRERARAFSWERAARETLAVYREAVERGPRRP